MVASALSGLKDLESIEAYGSPLSKLPDGELPALRTLKVMTRLGMGPCQGCMCWPAAARWIAAKLGRTVAEIGPVSVRPPLTPVSVGDLAAPALRKACHCCLVLE